MGFTKSLNDSFKTVRIVINISTSIITTKQDLGVYMLSSMNLANNLECSLKEFEFQDRKQVLERVLRMSFVPLFLN